MFLSVTLETPRQPAIRSFWLEEFSRKLLRFQEEAIAPIQNKVGPFVTSPILRNIVGQAQNKLDVRAAMDDGRILLANLSKGSIAEDISGLLGSLLTSSIQLVAMSRADIAESARTLHFLAVDEFQNYATESFGSILSEARKYRLSLTVANQYLAQLDEATLHAVFGNIGTMICFQAGAKDAELLCEQLGGDLQNHDLMAIPRYHAYVLLLIDGQPSLPFTMHTMPVRLRTRIDKRVATIRRTSQHRYCRPVAKIQKAIAQLLTAGGGEGEKKTPSPNVAFSKCRAAIPRSDSGEIHCRSSPS